VVGTPGPRWGEREILNLTIPEPDADTGEVVLVDGEGFAPHTAIGSAVTIRVILGVERIVFGELNGDGNVDAAVVLSKWRGGTSRLLYIAAVVDDYGHPRFVTREPLDSNIRVEPVITDRVISIKTIVHARDDHKLIPTVPWTFEFRLEGNQLVPRQPSPVRQ
jgi:hypothetical protein